MFNQNSIKIKKILKISLILFLFIFFLFSLSNNSFCAYPKLVNTIIAAFDQIKTWILRISTPAAAVAVRIRCFYEKI